MQLERRFTASEIKTDGGKLVGYAAVYESLSENLGGIREIISRGAFNRSLREQPDIRALWEHDTSKVLGRTKAGTLLLEPDQHGLRAEILLPDTTIGRDLLESVRRRDIDGMSFAFRVPRGGAEFDLRGDVPIRRLNDVELREISIVTFPAYPDAAVALRSLQEHRPTAIHRLRLQLANL